MGEPANSPVASAADQLELDRLQAILRTHSFGKMLRYTSSTASTNADALAYLQQHPGPASLNGMAILAECQTAGRGRRGRTWHSPARGNIYSSVIVVPEAGQPPTRSMALLGSAVLGTGGSRVPVEPHRSRRLREMAERSADWREEARRDPLRTDFHPNKTMAIVIGMGLNINATSRQFP